MAIFMKELWVCVLVVLIVVGGPKAFSPSGKAPSTAGPFQSELASTLPRPVKTNPKDGLNYVSVPRGRFQMGCSAGDRKCSSDEKPVHLVTITKDFWMGQTEVTQAAYQRVMKANPSHFHGDQLPVETVTWNQAKAYCEAVDGRLPTEAEWEYAARAGTTTVLYGSPEDIAWFGDNSGNTRINSYSFLLKDDLHYSQKLKANGNRTHPVAQKQPNAWGLYDMMGNVWEWVRDRFIAEYYKTSPSVDPPGPTLGRRRVVRGSSWGVARGDMRTSYRDGVQPFGRDGIIGFRCVRELFP